MPRSSFGPFARFGAIGGFAIGLVGAGPVVPKAVVVRLDANQFRPEQGDVTMILRQALRALTMSVLVLAAQRADAQVTDNTSTYKQETSGVRDFKLGATAVKVLIDSTTLGGGELELVHITFPPGGAPRAHLHGRVEVLYILSGELDHVVNGVSHPLRAGMAGIVRPGDQVIHRVTSADSVRALVMWAPGGELARIAP